MNTTIMQTSTLSVQWYGAVGIGPLTVTWPFSKLRADAEQLELSVMGLKRYTLDWEHIQGFERRVLCLPTLAIFPAFGMGIKIRHDKQGYPPLAFFPVFARSKRVMEQLEKLNYE